MRRSAIWSGRVWPQCGHFVRPASNFPASRCATVITTADRSGRCCTGDGEDIAAVEAAARRDRLEAHITAALPDWSLAAVVHALQALRGMALVAAATLVAELGDITRFANPRPAHGVSWPGAVRALHLPLQHWCITIHPEEPGLPTTTRLG
jgi:hypothetical protein